MKKWAKLLIPAILVITIAVAAIFFLRPASPAVGPFATMTEAAGDELPAAQTAGTQETAEAAGRPGFVQSEELILYLADSDFITGEVSRMGYTVLYGDRVAGDISLVDDAGKTVATLANDGSGRIDGDISFREDENRIGSLRAVCGSVWSREVRFYVHPRVDDGMMDRLYDVAEGMGDYVLGLNAEDLGSEEVLQQVVAYLTENPQVAQVAQVDGTVFYVTKDGLAGSYNMGLPELGYLGTSSADDAYESVLYEDNKHMHDTFIPSDLVLTNGKILLIVPQTMKQNGSEVHFSGAYEMMKAFAETINSQMQANAHSYNKEKVSVTQYVTDEARDVLLQGDFTDCGMLLLNMHGYSKKFDDNSRLVFMSIAGSEESPDIFSDHYDDDLWVTSRDEKWLAAIQKDTRAVFDTTIKYEDGRYQVHYTIQLTGNFFEQVLADKMFDNTIIYSAICHGMADENFVDLLKSHGAAVIIGCKQSFSTIYSIMLLSEITKSMAYADDSGIYGTAQAAMNQLSENSIQTLEGFLSRADSDTYEFVFQQAPAEPSISWLIFLSTSEHDAYSSVKFTYAHQRIYDVLMKSENRTDDPGLEIWDACAAEVGEMNDDERTRLMEEYFLSEYQKAVSEGRTAVFAYRNENIGKQFVVAGSGDVDGRVVCQLTDHKTTPMAEAEVKFYRWFNHTFEEDTRFRTQTDVNGCYSVEKLPYGIWAIESQYGDIKAFTTLEHHTVRCSAPDIEFRFALTGRVLQPDEFFTLTPCVGASVTLESLDGNGVAHSSQSTDASGDYCFMVPPGRYRITASKDGLTKSVQIKVDAESLTLNDAKEAIAEAKDIVLGAMVSGYVVDEVTGDPLSGVRVGFGTDELPTQTTDEKGYWSIHLPYPGSLAIYFTKEGYKDGEAHTGVIDGNHSFTQEMTPLAKDITGFVTDQKTGKALYDVTVTCSDGVHTYTAATKYDGTFILEKVLPGDYQLTFAKSGYVTAQMSAHHSSEAHTALDQLMLKPEGYVVFGRFRQTKGGGVKDIEWDVLEKDVANRRALMISHYGLYPIAYNAVDGFFAGYNTTWETCSLRAWLNNEFLNEAFNEEEQAAILLTDIDNSPAQGYRVGDIEEVGWRNYYWDTTGGNDTQDKIFVLSYAEAQKYYQTAYVEVSPFGDQNKGACMAARVSPTDYAAKYILESHRFLTEEGKPTASWWLRSPGKNQSTALAIGDSGVVWIDTHVNWDDTVVRPAMWVDLSVIEGLE